MALTQGKCLLQDIRTKAGLTQTQLCEKVFDKTGVKMSKATISVYETNRRLITHLHMRAICLALNKHEVDLYEWHM